MVVRESGWPGAHCTETGQACSGTCPLHRAEKQGDILRRRRLGALSFVRAMQDAVQGGPDAESGLRIQSGQDD